MLNILWAAMIIIGIVYGAFTGNLGVISKGAIDAAGEAVTLCVTMAGVMSMWTGLMEIADKSGLIFYCKKFLWPFMKWLFPGIDRESDSYKHMSMNVIANILGLGWAATPEGLLAMKELAKDNNKSETASDYMCTFLVINISSLQLIPVNIIAYRSSYGSTNPTAIIGAAIIATSISTLTGCIFCKIMTLRKNGH